MNIAWKRRLLSDGHIFCGAQVRKLLVRPHVSSICHLRPCDRIHRTRIAPQSRGGVCEAAGAVTEDQRSKINAATIEVLSAKISENREMSAPV